MVSICVEPSWVVRLALLAALLFLAVGLPIAIRTRRLGIALAAFPLLVNGVATYLGLVTVYEAKSRFPSAALSAGLAEAQMSLLFGAAAAVVASLIAAISASRRPNDEKPNRVLLIIVVAAATITAVEPPFALVFERYASRVLLISVAGFVFAGALAGLIASRGAAAKPLLIAGACEAAIGVEAWLAMRHFTHTAALG